MGKSEEKLGGEMCLEWLAEGGNKETNGFCALRNEYSRMTNGPSCGHKKSEPFTLFFRLLHHQISINPNNNSG